MAQQKLIWLVSMRTQVWSLASLRRLRIQCCHDLWCRLQMPLGSRIALIWPLAREHPYATDVALKRQKKKKKRTNKKHRINYKTRFKMAINPYLSITTLNVNGPNDPIKRHRVADRIQKLEPTLYCLQETHLRERTHINWKWGDKKVISCEWKKSRNCDTHFRQNRL